MTYMTSVERFGRQDGQTALILAQLTEQVGQLPDDLSSQIHALPLPQLQALAKALLKFNQLSDLQAWLELQN
jgi:hypothetical protein